MTIEILDCEQGSPEWFEARKGIPTASEFSTVMAKGEGKTRSAYMRKLAGEILTGTPMESYTNADMARGQAMEDEARRMYALLKDVDPVRVGFIRSGGKGCSPDSLIGDTAGLEIKSAAPHIQIERLLKGDLPSEHKAQVYGSMWVAERSSWDFVSYCPRLPLLVKTVFRDEIYIKNLASEVDRFNDELAAMVEAVRRYGEPEPAVANIMRAG